MTATSQNLIQTRIDITQGTDTKCPWHLVEYTRKDIGDGLTIKICDSCKLKLPMHPYAPKAGRVR